MLAYVSFICSDKSTSPAKATRKASDPTRVAGLPETNIQRRRIGLSSVYLGQKNKNQLTLNKAYPYLTLFPESISTTSAIFCTSAKEEPSPDYPVVKVFQVGKDYSGTRPAIQSWSSSKYSIPDSSPSSHARAVGRYFKLENLGTPTCSFLPSREKERMRVDGEGTKPVNINTSSSGSPSGRSGI